jgi:hypothetical protein
MGAALSAIVAITELIAKLNLTIPQGLILYRTLEGLVKGTENAFPDLPDSGVIAILKSKSEDNLEWTQDERARVAAELAALAASEQN